jgi:GNAT superfamily N-acetyltransferase
MTTPARRTQAFTHGRVELASANGRTLTCVLSTEVSSNDREALLDLFARSSARTRRERFHHALSVFPRTYLDEILDGRQLALAARDACHPELAGRVVGLASAAPMDHRAAEVAVWVADEWQRHGVGTLLLQGILDMLAERGITTAVGIVEPGNVAVRRMIERAVANATTHYEAGELVISMPVPQRSAA